MSNAAIVGMFGIGRKLLLTDALLQRLNERELSMVILHELAHCIRYHSWIRMIPSLVVIVLFFASMTFLSGIVLSMICTVLFVIFAVSLIGVCWWTEFDADRVAIEMAAKWSERFHHESQVFGQASDLCEALRKIHGERNMHRNSWMHPSCDRRLVAIGSLDSIDPLACDHRPLEVSSTNRCVLP